MPLPQELARGTVMPIVLALLADRPMYGYQIVKTVNRRSGGVLEFKEGTLYPLLHKMQGQRLLKSKWQLGDGSDDPDLTATGKKRKYYTLTPRGRRLLDTSRAQWTDLRGAVDSLLMGA